MKACPLISFQKEYRAETACMGCDCAFYDNHYDECLMTKALRTYIKVESEDDDRCVIG